MIRAKSSDCNSPTDETHTQDIIEQLNLQGRDTGNTIKAYVISNAAQREALIRHLLPSLSTLEVDNLHQNIMGAVVARAESRRKGKAKAD